MKKRSHFSQLPDAQALDQALKTEAQRPIPKGKENLNFPVFDLFLQWLKITGVSDKFFKQANWQTLINQGRDVQPQAIKKTLALVAKKDTRLLRVLKKIEAYLGEEDGPKKSDVIFVFGSRDLGRIRKAVIFWKQKLAPIILISGRSRFDVKERQEPEALVFKKEALRLGVPKRALITESNSITIADNVRSGLNILDEKNIKYKSMMTIVSWFAQRRAWSHLMKYAPLGTKIIRVNSDIKSPALASDNWFKNETGLNLVFSEFLKMKMGVVLNTA